eukprot:628712-Prymnesium_polylepis.1
MGRDHGLLLVRALIEAKQPSLVARCHLPRAERLYDGRQLEADSLDLIDGRRHRVEPRRCRLDYRDNVPRDGRRRCAAAVHLEDGDAMLVLDLHPAASVAAACTLWLPLWHRLQLLIRVRMSAALSLVHSTIVEFIPLLCDHVL